MILIFTLKRIPLFLRNRNVLHDKCVVWYYSQKSERHLPALRFACFLVLRGYSRCVYKGYIRLSKVRWFIPATFLERPSGATIILGSFRLSDRTSSYYEWRHILPLRMPEGLLSRRLPILTTGVGGNFPDSALWWKRQRECNFFVNLHCTHFHEIIGRVYR